MYENINKILKLKDDKIKKMSRSPAIVRWLSLERMRESLTILDKKVGYLLENFSKGGEGKLNQWLFTNDINFCTITAERYIIDYLISKNECIEDNLKPEGIDAKLLNSNTNLGIEITTINAFIAQWIYTERLTEIITTQCFLQNKSITIKNSPLRLATEIKNNDKKLLEYIDQVAESILENDKVSLKNLDIEIEIDTGTTGYILWESTNKNNFPWLKYLTTDLLQKLTSKAKDRQLRKLPNNIIFVGVNNIAPPNWVIPHIFDEIGNGGLSYTRQIEHIKQFWREELKHHSHILGICYFCYSLDSEKPFYPLEIFWRDELNTITIDL